MEGNREMSSIRRMLKWANYFGLFSGILLLLVFTYYMFDKSYTSWVYAPMLFAVVGFFSITNVFFCCYIINFLKKADDVTLLNNRYILALFSISIGGLFTPFVLAQMRNIPIESTISPKFTISKGYGGNSLVSGGLALVIYFALSQFSRKGAIFEAGLADQIVVIVFGAILAWGVLNCLLFATPNAKATWDKKGFGYFIMNFVAVINLIIATIGLILQLINSVLSIISIFADMFDRRRGFLGALFNATWAAYRIAMQLFIIYTINRIIKGIWSRADKVQYQDYSRLAEKQRNFEAQQTQG
ncbi:hypothetical protein [Spiroplasma endosymbiont of Diplazon laetatorius]|uniref:hypothetical protein n=1 Tax=Spiroplasma endosymbiont of Diplazon laetatorius TaxID=3066322 RepID=UPI0030CDEA71